MPKLPLPQTFSPTLPGVYKGASTKLILKLSFQLASKVHDHRWERERGLAGKSNFTFQLSSFLTTTVRDTDHIGGGCIILPISLTLHLSLTDEQGPMIPELLYLRQDLRGADFHSRTAHSTANYPSTCWRAWLDWQNAELNSCDSQVEPPPPPSCT